MKLNAIKINTSKLAAVVLGSLAVAWALALFFGLPFLYSKKVEALVGQPLLTVRQQLGNPTREWTPDDFQCESTLPCSQPSQGGPVLLYADKAQGWYLYFDRGNVLARLERSPPVNDKAQP